MKKTECGRRVAKRGASKVRVEVATHLADDELEAVAGLFGLLKQDGTKAHVDDIRDVCGAREAKLLVARDASGRILGVTTLLVSRTGWGKKARLEDVVVSEAARGMGLGEKLVRTAHIVAKGLGAKSIELTSHPSRTAANELYKKLGYVLRDTNCYSRKL